MSSIGFQIIACFILCFGLSKGSQSIKVDMPSTPSTDSLIYFLAGALLPAIAYFVLAPKQEQSFDPIQGSDDEEDEDMEGVQQNGSSSKWGMMDGPYKVCFRESSE